MHLERLLHFISLQKFLQPSIWWNEIRYVKFRGSTYCSSFEVRIFTSKCFERSCLIKSMRSAPTAGHLVYKGRLAVSGIPIDSSTNVGRRLSCMTLIVFRWTTHTRTTWDWFLWIRSSCSKRTLLPSSSLLRLVYLCWTSLVEFVIVVWIQYQPVKGRIN